MINREPSNPYMKAHLNNIKRAVGSRGIEYEYILNTDDLTRAWMEARKDLNYALRKEVKRDRYVLNTEGLQRDLEKALTQAINEASDQLHQMVLNDLIPDIERTLNLITVQNGQFKAPPIPKRRSSWASQLGKMLGKAIAKSTVKIFEDMTKPDRRRK